jgi:hypothetical protein
MATVQKHIILSEDTLCDFLDADLEEPQEFGFSGGDKIYKYELVATGTVRNADVTFSWKSVKKSK